MTFYPLTLKTIPISCISIILLNFFSCYMNTHRGKGNYGIMQDADSDVDMIEVLPYSS